MKKTFLLFAMILIPIFSFSQANSDIDKLIDSLSWNSITCDHSYHTFIVNYQDSAVCKLIQIGKPATDKLLRAIDKPSKTVIIHIILTKIIESGNNNDYLPILYIYKDCNNLIGWHHIFNGLIWEWYSDSNYTITPIEIDKVKLYWTKRLNGEIDSLENNTEQIFQLIAKSDSTKFPCYKKYDNNSDKLVIDQLIELIGTKYQSDKFGQIFKILGNDSTVSKFDDCFFVSYGADGIDFRFNKDNYLTTLFFGAAYKSRLIYDIKLTDTKSELLNKLGVPNEQRDNWIWYDKNGLGIDFYDDNKIKSLQINKK